MAAYQRVVPGVNSKATKSLPRSGSASTRALNNVSAGVPEYEKLKSQCDLQLKTIQAFKEQVGKLKALLQACAEENERLSRELARKKTREEGSETAGLRAQVEELRRELQREKNEKDRIRMEKEVQEKLTKKLNEKIYVRFGVGHAVGIQSENKGEGGRGAGGRCWDWTRGGVLQGNIEPKTEGELAAGRAVDLPSERP